MRVSIKKAMRMAREKQVKEDVETYRRKVMRVWTQFQTLDRRVSIRTIVSININTDRISTGLYPVLYGVGSKNAEK